MRYKLKYSLVLKKEDENRVFFPCLLLQQQLCSAPKEKSEAHKEKGEKGESTRDQSGKQALRFTFRPSLCLFLLLCPLSLRDLSLRLSLPPLSTLSENDFDLGSTA